MKKITIFIITAVAAVWLCTFGYAAELDKESIYSEQYSASGADKLQESLPDEVREKLYEFDISSTDISWTEAFTPKNIFANSVVFLKSGGKRPITAGCAVLAVLLLGAALGNLSEENKLTAYVMTVGITAAAVLPAVSIIKSCVSAISSAGVFMLSFVPVYASILISRGKAVTAAGFSAVMLTVSEAVTALCSFVIVPLTGIQLALSVSGSVLTEINTSSISKAIKKASIWILSLSATVLFGLLGIQTVVGGAADTLSSKTAKFIIGTAVPVVGTTVSEALSTVRGCIKLLGSSVAVYSIAALALLFLPTIVELLLWRVSLLLCASVAEMLGQERSAGLIRSVDSAVAFVLGIMILIGVLFIISVTVVAVV